jgi:nicotinate-nucleotide--dimethylbenzimidazole phosphoribosyltransferase
MDGIKGCSPSLVSAQDVKGSITHAIAWDAINAKTKPLGALGQLESCAVQLAVLQQSRAPVVERSRVCVFAADHGVADEGVSAYPRAVTAEMMKNFNAGGAAINVIGRANGTEVEVLDVGVDADLTMLKNVAHCKVRRGTRNFAVEAAMTSDERDDAIAVGTAAIARAVADRVHAVGLGEMGIANTTSAAALLSALTGVSASSTAGRGTGITTEALRAKEAVITKALSFHSKDVPESDPAEWLRRVGGLEIAAMTGAALAARRYNIAIVADGFISTVAVLCAVHIAAREAANGAVTLGNNLFVAHRSAERGHQIAIQALEEKCARTFHPLLDLQMRLGEGSGAALAMPLLKAASRIMSEMATFESAGVSTGERLEPTA